MPPIHTLVLASLMLLPASYSIALLLLDTHTPPYQRTVRALGNSLLIKAGIGGALGMLGLFMEHRALTTLPLVVVVLAGAIALRIMQTEGV
ncbi:MAG: hypothetical protein H6673_02465 [Anaerolineales bacterium]|nr:hypothetical protein [Anaerolineales bacterium]